MKHANYRIVLPEGLTQGKLSQVSGVVQPIICRVLTGDRGVRAETARKLARACEKLGLPMTIYDWLFPAESTSPMVHHLTEE